MDAIQESMATMMEMFQDKFNKFKNELKNAPDTVSSNSSLTMEFASFKVFVLQAFESLKKQIEILVLNVDRLDMHSRRKILLLHGIPEDKNKDTTETVLKVIQDKFKLSEFSSDHIQRCHRMGRLQDPSKQRPILIKFCDITIRNKIWFDKTVLKGSGITVSEFLTKIRHNIFVSAREKFRISKCWTRDGHVYVLGPDGSRQRINSLDAITKISQQSKVASEQPLKNIKTRPKRPCTIKK